MSDPNAVVPNSPGSSWFGSGVREYGRSQLELARLMRCHQGAVSRWYSRAVARVDEIERLSEPVLERLSEIERGHALVSGQRVQPMQEPGAVTFNSQRRLSARRGVGAAALATTASPADPPHASGPRSRTS
jgi:hypothetical protein